MATARSASDPFIYTPTGGKNRPMPYNTLACPTVARYESPSTPTSRTANSERLRTTTVDSAKATAMPSANARASVTAAIERSTCRPVSSVDA